MIETATYIGSLRLVGSDSYAASLFRAHALTVPTQAEFRIEYARDGKAERLRYFRDGQPWGTLFRDASALAEVVPGFRRIVFRPLEERGGYTMLGFLLPPSATDLFFRARDSKSFYNGDPCLRGEQGCADYVVPLNFVGADQIARVVDGGRTASLSLLGRPQAQWMFGPLRGRYPKTVEFTEWRGGVRVAEARYVLDSVRQAPGSLNRLDLVPVAARKDTLMEVRRGASGFGGAYDPNVRDVWAQYRQQERIWSRIEQDRRPPYATIALGILLLSALAWGGFRFFKGRVQR